MKRVLVVDDEEMIRWSIDRTLRTAGYEVLAAETGAEGMALFRRERPAVVLLDVRLPDISGLALLEQMKTESAAAVIMMTAFDEDCSAADALRLGADTYLQKPFDFQELEKLIDQTLERCP